jgi:GIY-YIG catalytic domain
MSIDNCPYDFDQLVNKRMALRFSELATAMRSPLSASGLVGPKSATKAALQFLNRQSDFPGCYVFLNADTPVYVGISRTVARRLTQHLNHVSHYSASLVYRMASRVYDHELKRDQAMADDKFRETFLSAQLQLQKMRVAFIEIPDDVELYMFELYAAMKLNTWEWNTFRTH